MKPWRSTTVLLVPLFALVVGTSLAEMPEDLSPWTPYTAPRWLEGEPMGDEAATKGFEAAPETKISPSDAESGDWFGDATAVAGTTAIVGSPKSSTPDNLSGSAYVFERDLGGAGAWGERTRIVASNAIADALFGQAISLSVDVAVVGAPGVADGGLVGAAYVFYRDRDGADNWGEVVILTASDGAADNQFGYSVSVSDDIAVVGAYRDEGMGPGAGAVYVFERNAGGVDAWGEVAKITASDASWVAWFGWSVAISSETLVVGAQLEDGAGGFAGAAYVYDRDHGGPDAWGEVAKITASDAADNDRFGCSVAIDGDTAIVGAFGNDDAGTNSGAAYIFERDRGGPDGWGETAKITALDAAIGDNFGEAVSLSGGTAVVGASADDDMGSGSGSVYVFGRNSGGADAWGHVDKLVSATGAASDKLGKAVCLSGQILVAGAPWDEVPGMSNSGTASVFEPVNSNGEVFVDGFESGDTSRWSETSP